MAVIITAETEQQREVLVSGGDEEARATATACSGGESMAAVALAIATPAVCAFCLFGYESWRTAQGTEARLRTRAYGPYHISVLVLLSNSRGPQYEAILGALGDAASSASHNYTIHPRHIQFDYEVKALLDETNPAIVVTTGQHLMSLMLNGSENLGQAAELGLQSVRSLHGQFLPAHSSWGMPHLRVFPLEASGSHSPLRRRQSLSGGACSPPSSPPATSSSDSSSIMDLSHLFALLNAGVLANSPALSTAPRMHNFPHSPASIAHPSV